MHAGGHTPGPPLDSGAKLSERHQLAGLIDIRGAKLSERHQLAGLIDRRGCHPKVREDWNG